MTAKELIEALRETGSGAARLELAEQHLAVQPAMTAHELLGAMSLVGIDGRTGWPEGTRDKAKRLLAGTPLSELMGVPPPNAEEAKMTALAKLMAEKTADAFGERFAAGQANNVAVPEAHKPAKAK